MDTTKAAVILTTNGRKDLRYGSVVKFFLPLVVGMTRESLAAELMIGRAFADDGCNEKRSNPLLKRFRLFHRGGHRDERIHMSQLEQLDHTKVRSRRDQLMPAPLR
jgi:hypothetical protein